MKALSALLPHKHVKFSESLIGLAGMIRTRLDPLSSFTLDEIMTFLQKTGQNNFSKLSFDDLIMAVDILFAINVVELDTNNRIKLKNEID